MMSDVKISQIGHVAAHPEMIFVGAGEERVARTRLVVISNRRLKDRDTGAVKERTTRVSWTLWRAQAENAMKYLTTGSHVAIDGRLENNDYTKDNEKEFNFNFVAERVEYLDSKADSAARAARVAEGAAEHTETEEAYSGSESVPQEAA
jgi:single stranded DNA-binding protein